MEHTYLTGDVPTRQEFLDLARKAEQLRVAHEATGLVTWAWEIGSDHLEWHGDISTFLGMPPESFKGRFRDYLGMLHVEDAGPARDAFVDCLKGRRSHYRREERIIQPDGSVRWLEAHGRGFYGSAGGAVRMVGVFSDVSYRKAQEEALAVSEERFFKAYHATPDGIALSRVQDGMIVEVNAAFSRITGLSAGELLGKTSTSLGLWGDGDKRTEAMRPLVETGRIRDLVGSLITRAGDRRTVVFNAERILVGDVPYLMSVTRDITDQYLAERALAKSERRYRSLFDSALDVIVILSAKGEIIDANRAACLASGYELAVLTGRSIKDLVDPHDRGGKVNRTTCSPMDSCVPNCTCCAGMGYRFPSKRTPGRCPTETSS